MRARVRAGGQWVDSNLAGNVLVGGDWVPFAPASTGGGTVDEYLTIPDPLSHPDWADDNTNVAVRFAVTVPATFVGVRYWRPPTFSPGGSVFGCNHDTGSTRITDIVAEPTDGALGAWSTLMFAEPAAIVPGVNYLAAYHTSRYGFSRVTDGATLPFLSPSSRIYTDALAMNAVAFYRFGPAAGVGDFTSSANFHYNVSPIVRFAA